MVLIPSLSTCRAKSSLADKSAGLHPFIRLSELPSVLVAVVLQQPTFISCQACAFVFALCTGRQHLTAGCQSSRRIFPTFVPFRSVPAIDRNTASSSSRKYEHLSWKILIPIDREIERRSRDGGGRNEDREGRRVLKTDLAMPGALDAEE